MKEKIQQYLSTKWPAIIWSVFVFILLVLPPEALNKERKIEIVQLDKIIHFFLFGILAGLWAYYKKQQRQKQLFPFLFIVAVTAVYGIATEFVQDWVGRDFDVWDMVADAAGALVFVCWVWYKKEDPGRNRGRNQN
jgi:VanZ family protein